MARNLDGQMDVFKPLEVMPTDELGNIQPPLPDPNAPEYQQMRKAFLKDVGKGAITSPITGAADIVELGAGLPDPSDAMSVVSPTYTAIEEAFDQLANLGINRENAEKLIKGATSLELEGTAGELTGEIIGLPVAAASKAATKVLKIAKKYGDKAGDYIGEIADETREMFRAASGGDDVDGMSLAVAGDGTSTVNKTTQQTDKAFTINKSENSIRDDAKYRVDNPGYNPVYEETYAQTKQKYADEAKQKALDRGETDTYAANLGSTEGVTGFMDNAKFKPEELKNIPGAMGEEKIRSSGEKLERLKSSIAEEGYKPDNIMIHVREDGQPFIVEGNHRLAEALESGRETITADIRYLRGAEEADGPLKPSDILPEKNDYEGGRKVFHSTSADFDEFDFVRPGEADIGFHVGTSQQANARLRSSGENIREGERVLPLQLKKKLKPARVPDVSFFSEPARWRAELAVPTSEKQVLRFLLDDAEDAAILSKGPSVRVGDELYLVNPQAARQGATKDEEFWKDLVRASVAAEKKLDTKNFEDKKKWFETLKGVANKHNYDSFVYKNQYEGSSEAGLDTLVDQIKKASKGDLDPSEVDMLSKFDDSYMLLEPDQAKGLFGGRTSGEPEFMKYKGGLV